MFTTGSPARTTDAFPTVANHENLPRATLQQRLLPWLNGAGANAGLKRMASGQEDVAHKDLLYARCRSVTREGLHEAMAVVASAILRARHPSI